MEQPALTALVEHIKRGVPLCENIFRSHSEAYFEVFRLARKLRESGDLPELDWESEEMLQTDLGESVWVRGLGPVYLDMPYHDDQTDTITEAEYQGKSVQLNKPKRGGSKKFYVYVMNPKTQRVKKISFGDPGLRTRTTSAARKRSFAARHQCEKKNDKMKAGYWACRLPRYGLVKGGGKWW